MHPPSYSPLFPQQPNPSESLFLTFPKPTIPSVHSDSPLHSPGSDPLESSALYTLFRSSYGGQSINSPDTNADTQNWIVKQVRSMRYEAAAIASLGSSAVSASFPSTWNDIWVRQLLLLPNLSPEMLPMPNQTKANEPMRCEVFKVDCISKDVFEKHVSEEKHKKHLQLLNNSTKTIMPGASHASLQSQISRVQGQDLFGVSRELESKKQKLVSGGAAVDSVRVCTICNVACNSQDVYNKHLSGKKHAAQIILMSDNGIGPYLAAFKRHGIGPWKKDPKKITQLARCELCQISCNSRDVYMTHIAGKKHLRNLELLSKSNSALQRATNPVIRPQERPKACKDEGINSHKPNKAAMVEDIEAKKRKLIKGGAAETDIRICTLCNVVCNSQTVFKFHLAGQKHAAMVKLKQKQPGSNYIYL